jgi:Co/Zn/Cd efflux system component
MPCDDCAPQDTTHAATGYQRALWIVVLLNLGMGTAEMVAGFLSRSQSLKADALDFIGDGTITFVALLATRWSSAARARVAMVQGIFLALLGLGVLATTAYRVLIRTTPEAETMTVFGIGAFLVNVASAAVLLKHRHGDAGVVAVWLFSRNDALGNLAVIAAGLFVWWLSSPIPDLVVAAAIAGLFLHSAWRIIQRSRKQLVPVSVEG